MSSPDRRAFAPARWVILVHGGAGDLPADKLADHAAGCARAAEKGAEVLRAGGSAIDAVQAAVLALEDDPRFNAGTGACLNEEGSIELDASIMDGALRAGAVAALSPFKNPIAIARTVLDAGRHVLYAGEGAARFARAHGFSPADPESMITEAARKKWQDLRSGKTTEKGWAGGTVGAVAKDANGHVAAATSTGGMVDKAVGRVGDSPLVGAGTWADDERGAVSTTGHGESFIRTAFAARVFDDVRGPLDTHAAARLEAMHARVGGTGGVILVDREGRAAFARITRTMSWALVDSEGTTEAGA